MLNKRRIATMAKMTIYEKGHGKKDIQIYEHFKWDYVSKNMVIAAIIITVLYLIAIACVALFKIDYVLNIIVEEELYSLMVGVGLGALAVAMASGIIFYFVYASHYKKAQKNAGHYFREMKRLNYIYMKEAENERNL